MPEELAQQMPVLKELLTDLGFVQVSSEGWEADDILGTLAAACEAAGGTTLLATGDRDSLQLVDDNATGSAGHQPEETISMDAAAIREKVRRGAAAAHRRQEPDGRFVATTSPACRASAKRPPWPWWPKFGTLEGVYANLEDKAIKPGQRAKLSANRDKAGPVRTCWATIRKDAPDRDGPRRLYPPAPATRPPPRSCWPRWKCIRHGGPLGSGGGRAPLPPPVDAAPPEEGQSRPPCRCWLEGRLFVAQNADGGWYVRTGARKSTCQATDRPGRRCWTAMPKSGPLTRSPSTAWRWQHGGRVGRALHFDGKLAAYLLNPSATSYAVKSLAAEYGVAAAFHCEAAPDAGVLAALLERLAAELDASGQRKLHDEMELPLARVLADMERIGFAVDADGIRAFGDSLRGELDGILQNIYTEVGYEFNVNSPKQLGEALFDKLGLPPRKKNARGYSTDAATLESLRRLQPGH